MKVTNMTCDYMKNPVGYDFSSPCFGWTGEESNGNFQTAYEMQVASDAEFDCVIYDSGKKYSPECVCVQPEMMQLVPRTRYFWRVRIWDDNGDESPWSEVSFFETAKYDEPWAGKWIGWDFEFPQLRGEFTVDKTVRSARAYACGVGLYVMNLNGSRVSDEKLTPGINAYDSWLQYQTYDITDLIRPGKNAIGCQLGNGYYKGRVNWPEIRERFGDRHNIFGDKLAFICEVHISFTDGSELVYSTDESWKACHSPWLRAEIYDGEVFDSRRIIDGWCTPEYDASSWDNVSCESMDMSLLKAKMGVSVRLHEQFKPVEAITTPAGETVLDFGQNLAGMLSFDTCVDGVNLPEGCELLFQFGEVLDKDGNFYRDNMRTALAEIRYICDGKHRVYIPEFTFFGFRYVKVTGWQGNVNKENFTSIAIYSDMEQTGTFSCSDERVNRLFLNSLWGQKSNFVDIPTDCPQRDERLGWTGDAQVFCPTASMNMNTDPFFRKYLHDLAIEQKKDGYVPVVVPNILRKTGIWQLPITGWGDAATIIPWNMYIHFGDKAVLEKQYPSMKAWVDYMQNADTLGVDRYYLFSLGDWLAQDTKDPDNFYGLTPTDLISTAYYAMSTRIVAKSARLLGYDDDAEYYESLESRIEKAFRKEYVSESGRIISETQTAQALALEFKMLLPEQKHVAASHLAERVQIDHSQLTTGFIGTPCICPALSDNGYNAYAYALLLQTKCPSWLYEVNMGATTVWERWNSVREDGSFGPVGMNSMNHYSFGAVSQWLYQYVAGIKPVEDAPGFKHSLLRPMPNDQLQHASASIVTPYGRISSSWKLSDGHIMLEFEVPFNTTAEIVLPDTENAEIYENGVKIDNAPSYIRNSGKWVYEYAPSMNTISARVPPIVHPDI